MSDPIASSDTQPFQPVAPEPATPDMAPVTEPVVATGVKPGSNRPRGSTWINVALGVALAVAIGGVGFAAGRMTAPVTTAAAGGNGFRNGGGLGAGGNGFPGGQFPGGGYFGGGDNNGGGFRGIFGNGGASIQGTVESVSGDTLTLKLANGQTIQVSLSGTTTYHSQASATAGDVQTGGTVIVRVQITRGQGGGTTTPSATDVTIVP